MATDLKNVCRVVFRMMPALWGLLAAASIPARTAGAAELPSPSDILTRYAENLDKIESFTLTMELESYGDSSWSKRRNNNEPIHTIATLRSDGDRLAWRRDKWGTFVDGTKATQDVPRHGSGLWDGDHYYQYNQGLTPKDPSWVTIHRPTSDAEKAGLVRERGIVQSPAAPCLGLVAQDADRVDQVLQQARRISVAPEMERVGDSDCYVIEAETDSGRYKVWFDPEHGYNIAKAVVDRKAGDRDITRTLKGDMVAQYTYENTRFEKFGDVWMPVEGNRNSYQTWRKGRFATNTSRWMIADFELDPDHEALGSFRTDDIREGSRVYLKWAPGIHYRWENGGYKGSVDESGLESLVHEVTQIMAEADTDAVLPDGVQRAVHAEQAKVAEGDETHPPSTETDERSARAPSPSPLSQVDAKPPYWPMVVGVIVLFALAVIVGYRRVLYA